MSLLSASLCLWTNSVVIAEMRCLNTCDVKSIIKFLLVIKIVYIFALHAQVRNKFETWGEPLNVYFAYLLKLMILLWGSLYIYMCVCFIFSDSLHRLLDDPSAEVTNYKLKLSFFSVILLHEDPPATPSDEMDPGQTSTEKLRKMSMQFFSRAASINTAGVEDLADLRQQFTQACPFDHLG